jgi:hypothetical protein
MGSLLIDCPLLTTCIHNNKNNENKKVILSRNGILWIKIFLVAANGFKRRKILRRSLTDLRSEGLLWRMTT